MSFDLVVAIDEIVAGGNRLNQGVDRCILQFIVQIHGADPAGMVTKPVGNHFVCGQGVEDMGEDMIVFPESLGHLGCSCLPDIPFCMIQVGENFFL